MGGGKTHDLSAFTLAEVLITIGIVGIVAAMTIPSLVAKIQLARLRAALRKEVAELNQAAKLYYETNDLDFSSICFDKDECSYTSYNYTCNYACNYACNNYVCNYGTTEPHDVGDLLTSTLTGVKALGVAYYPKQGPSSAYTFTPNTSYTNRGGALGSPEIFTTYQLSNGAIIGFQRWTPFGACTKNSLRKNDDFDCAGFIDINGRTGPNKEVVCENEKDTKKIFDENYKSCKISSKSLGDIVPVIFYDQTLEISTNAGRELFNISSQAPSGFSNVTNNNSNTNIVTCNFTCNYSCNFTCNYSCNFTCNYGCNFTCNYGCNFTCNYGCNY
jgi:type II secretory pathway pseudopilin PulG